MGNVLDILKERGFVKDISDEDGLRKALEKPISLYCGYDPTASSLQVGNLVTIMTLAHFQRAGHRPIVVVGGGTGMIGDPSGKTTQRALMTLEDIQANLAAQRKQFARFLEFTDGKALIVNNADWLLPLGYIAFLRDIGRYFSVNQMLQHETYRERLAGEGLSFIEFNYVLLQAYDFLHLYRELNCVLQIGGADQWFNILAGADLIRRVEGGEAFAFTSPLIMTSSGKKMGKSEAGTIWLDPNRTSPYEYYQYWVNTEDPDVERLLALFTFLPMDEVRRLGRLQGADLRAAKQVLAFEATRICHGEQAAIEAREAAQTLFGGGGGAVASVPSATIDASLLKAGVPAAQLLVDSGLCSSRSEARRLIEQGGAYANEQRLALPEQVITEDWLADGALMLRAGKKRYLRVVPK